MTTNPIITANAATVIANMRTIEASAFAGATNVVPLGATLDGAMSSAEDLALRIDGEFKGTLVLAKGGAIHIGPDAVLDCKLLQADIIFVQGRVKGEIQARKALELAPTARVSGKLSYEGRLDVHSGARINGSIDGPEQE
jgi:cytoskeletal protein CcmA (bactofilin family)